MQSVSVQYAIISYPAIKMVMRDSFSVELPEVPNYQLFAISSSLSALKLTIASSSVLNEAALVASQAMSVVQSELYSSRPILTEKPYDLYSFVKICGT